MNIRTLFLSFLMLLSVLSSCKEDAPQAEMEVDKEKVLAALTAPERFWMFEDITMQVGDKVSSVMMDSSTILPNACPYLNYQFKTGGILDEEFGSGIYGIKSYPTKARFIFWYSDLAIDGMWAWDEVKKTIVVKGLKSVLMTDTAYLDTASLPNIKNKEEAQAATTPERIKMIMTKNDPKLGSVTYVYTLRSSWVTKFIAGSTRARHYEVLY